MTDDLRSKIPSPIELRAELCDMVRRDLLGPAGGPEEEVDELNVRGRYILGLLAPRGQSIVPDEQDELAVDGAGDAEDTKADVAVPQTASMLPSAIGLTFSVDGAAQSIEVTARWGRYRRVVSEVLQDKEGKPRRVWKREPVRCTSGPLELKEGKIEWTPDEECKEVYVRGRCRWRDGAWSVTLFLVNAQKEPKTRKDSAWVFQPELIVRGGDGGAIFIKRQVSAELNVSEGEDRAMEMLYRRRVEFAVGHGVAVEATLAEGSWDRAVEVRTEVMPTHEVERMEPPTAEEIPLLGQAVLDMEALGRLEEGEFGGALNPIVEAYGNWIEEQETRLNSSPRDLEAYQADAEEALKTCRKAMDRIQAGIALLDENGQVAEAFRFANRAMHLQRVRSLYSRAVRQGQQVDMAEIDVPENRSWYPFQLAFVLLNLPALADPTHPDRSDPTQAIADLLWFPTGGGKTEAYLGVSAFAMGVRRLQGELGGRGGHAGVVVLMRYTLRLLTLQQFQRAASLICACEVIRRDDPGKWGDEPFRLGLWVGMRSTPNWTDQSAEALRQDHGFYRGGSVGGVGSPHQLTNCPWCGKAIDPGGNDIRVETYTQGRARTFQYCGDKYGQCPFSYRQSPDEGLPVIVVDEEIYRRLPTMVIATVDKFAQMPWKGETQMLFGQVNGYCPRHGYRSPEIEDRDHHRKRGRLPAVATQPAEPLRPPDLIIQDELHLISGPLGTLVGLYETAVDHLASWELEGTTIRPKVVASTATVRRAKEQIHGLFVRQVKVFPPSGLDAEDNFFSRRRPSSDTSPGRLYMGVCAPGTRLKTALIRVYVAQMAAAQVLYERYGRAADPWMTLVGYFNSLRELGGMRRLVEDTVQTRLMRMERRGLAHRSIRGVEELTSRRSSTEIPHILDRLESAFDPEAEKERKARRKAGKRVEHGKTPLDVVLATNMISVGVDVSRLGLMVVANQPKATAEYIQATSRVGRRYPGVVCTVYNWARPRDLSHYERFGHYHATFYQHVEALSVTPFSARALDRGLSAVMVSFVRLLGEAFNANERAGQLERQHRFPQTAVADMARRASRVLGSQQAGGQVRGLVEERVDEWLAQAEVELSGAVLGYRVPWRGAGGRIVNLLKRPTEDDWETFTCLNSLRDVEPDVRLILRDGGMDRPRGASGEQVDGEAAT